MLPYRHGDYLHGGGTIEVPGNKQRYPSSQAFSSLSKFLVLIAKNSSMFSVVATPPGPLSGCLGVKLVDAKHSSSCANKSLC